MDDTTLGATGVTVGAIGLGGNTQGLDTLVFDSSDRWDWTLDEAESKAIVEKAIDREERPVDIDEDPRNR